MKDDTAAWTVIWCSLAMTFIDAGYFPLSEIERGARERAWPLSMVSDVLKALAVESFEHAGEVYLRLSDKVVPIVPNRQQDKRAATGGSAA